MPIIRGFPTVNINFPENLDKLHYTGQHIYGGSGGVYVLEDEQKNRFVLKLAQEESIFKDEIVTDGLYRSLSVPVPDFAVYNEIPAQLADIIGCKEHVLCRLTPFLENELYAQPNEIVAKGIADFFVPDAFFSNSDLHLKNFILNNKTLYRIDNGASIRFHALGRVKVDNQIVNEIELFRADTFLTDAGTAYKTLNKTDIQRQVDQLIGKSDILLESYLRLHKALALNSPSLFEKLLISRMSYLMEHYAFDLHEHPNRYAFAVPGYSSASTLLIKRNPQGDFCVLVGKRVRHDYWSDFGGASEVSDTLLEKTAFRELHEETNGFIKAQVPSLHNAIFHDQIKNGKKHRTYLVPLVSDEELDNKLKAGLSEHTECRWLPIASIVNALRDNTTVICENQETLSVLDADKQKIMLFPAMNDSLHDPIIMSQLSSIAQGKWPTKSTINRLSADYPLRLTHSINSHKFNQRFHPSIVSEQYAKTIQKKEPMLASLRAHDYKVGIIKISPQITSVSCAKLDSLLTQETEVASAASLSDLSVKIPGISVSEFQINVALTANERQLPLKQRIQAILGQNTWQLKYTESDIDHLDKMIAQETNYPESAPLYHATQPEMVFLNRLFSVFRNKLDSLSKKNHLFFRPLDVAFADGFSLQQFQDDQKARFQQINYYNPGYSDRMLSVNYHLLGNFFVEANKTSCSLYYFLNEYVSNPPAFDQYLTYLLSMLSIQETYTQIKQCFEQTYSHIGSCMLQIFLKKEVIDQVLYPAGANGTPYPFIEANGLETAYKTLSEKVLFSDQQQIYLNKLRGGLYLLPEVMHSDNVSIHEYHRQSLPDNADKLIDDLVSTLVYQFLRKNNLFSGMSFTKKPLLLKHFELLKQVEPYSILDDEMDVNSLIANTIFRNEAAALESLLAYCPSFSLTMTVKNPDYKKNNSANVIVIDLLNNANKDIMKVIFTYLKNHHQFYSALHIKTNERNNSFLDLLIKQKLKDEVLEILDWITDIKPNEVRNLLKSALVYGNEALYTYLIKKYTIIEFEEFLKDTYHDLGNTAYPVFIGAIFEDSFQSVKFLHDMGTNLTLSYPLTKADDSVWFPKQIDAISFALYKGNLEIINYLLPHVTENLTIDAKNSNVDKTYAPWLEWAVSSGKIEVVQLVLDYYKKNSIDITSRLYQKFDLYRKSIAQEIQVIKEVIKGKNDDILKLLLPYVDHTKDKYRELSDYAESYHNMLYLNHFYENMPDKKIGQTLIILLNLNFSCNDFYYDKLSNILLDKGANLSPADKKQQVLDYFANNSEFLQKILIILMSERPAGLSLIIECLHHVKQDLDKNSLCSYLMTAILSNNLKLANHFFTQMIQSNPLIKRPKTLLNDTFSMLLRTSYEDRVMYTEEMSLFFKEKLLQLLTLPFPGKDSIIVGDLSSGDKSTNIPALQFKVDLLNRCPGIDANICLLNAYYHCAFNQTYEKLMFIESTLAQMGLLTDDVIKTAFYCMQLQWHNFGETMIRLCEHFIGKITTLSDYLTFDGAICDHHIQEVTLNDDDYDEYISNETDLMVAALSEGLHLTFSKKTEPNRLLHLLYMILSVANNTTGIAKYHSIIQQIILHTLDMAASWQLPQGDLEYILDILRQIVITANEKEFFQRYIAFKKTNHLPLVKDDIGAMIRFDDLDMHKDCYQQAMAFFPVKTILSLLIDSNKIEFNHREIAFLRLKPQQNKLSLVMETKSNALITHLFEHEKITDQVALKCLLDAAKQNKADIFNLIFDKLKTVPNDLLKTVLSDYRMNQAYLYKILSKTDTIDVVTLQTALERGNNRLATDIYLKALELGNHLELSPNVLHCLSKFIAIGNVSAEKKLSARTVKDVATQTDDSFGDELKDGSFRETPYAQPDVLINRQPLLINPAAPAAAVATDEKKVSIAALSIYQMPKPAPADELQCCVSQCVLL